jgi:hypothetical protein
MATALGNSFQALLFEDTLHSTPVPQLVGMRGEWIGGLISLGPLRLRAAERARWTPRGCGAVASDRAAGQLIVPRTRPLSPTLFR